MLIRNATPADAAAMSGILNEIIALGGTTAHQRPMAADDVALFFITGPEVETSVLAEDAGLIIGWQSVGLWQGEMHIGTFVRTGVQAKGVGMALFAATCQAARARNLTSIIAHIRADNTPGLAYYSKIGFQDVGFDPNFALDDGTVVGRIFRQFDLTSPDRG